jgi:hypothetical protein
MREYKRVLDSEGRDIANTPVLVNKDVPDSDFKNGYSAEKVFLLTEEELERVRKIAVLEERIRNYKEHDYIELLKFEGLEEQLKTLMEL